MNIPNEKFEEIAQANDIVDVISGYIDVKKKGKSRIRLNVSAYFPAEAGVSLFFLQGKRECLYIYSEL